MVEHVICTICPIGCNIEVIGNKKTEVIESLKGYDCPRGKKFATNEFIAPIRTITTTMKIEGGSDPLVSVRTDGGVLKDRQFECMDIIREITLKPPVKREDILIENILGTGVNVIATGEVL